MNWSRIGAWIKNTTAILLVGVLAYAGETGADGGFIKDLWAQAKLASPFAAMLSILAWLDEKRERRSAQQQCYDRTIEYINSTNLQNVSITNLGEAFKALAPAPTVRRRRRRTE